MSEGYEVDVKTVSISLCKTNFVKCSEQDAVHFNPKFLFLPVSATGRDDCILALSITVW